MCLSSLVTVIDTGQYMTDLVLAIANRERGCGRRMSAGDLLL